MPDREVIAYCGFRCDLCPAFEANVTERTDKKKINEGWLKYYGFTVPEDEMSCRGCRESACTLDPNCAIRPCAAVKGLSHCGECPEYAACEKLNSRADIAAAVRRRHEGRISPEDERLFFAPYEGRENLCRLRGKK